MNWSNRKFLLFVATVGVSIAVGLGIGPLLRSGVSPGTAGIVAGVLGTLCIFGIGFGIWNVRRGEARRKAKEQIWLKH